MLTEAMFQLIEPLGLNPPEDESVFFVRKSQCLVD